MSHISVLYDEVLDHLAPKAEGRYLDGTLGLGGHTLGIFERSKGRAWVLGLDRDTNALERAAQRLFAYRERAFLEHSVFSDFPTALEALGWGKLDGAILDLGVSSMQLDESERGFSFLADGPLDMRMSQNGPEAPASKFVNTAKLEDLKMIIGKYGEEPMGGRIAKAIIKAREEAPIMTTGRLAEVVAEAYPAGRRAKSRMHPATKTFQALRIVVNRELQELQDFLDVIPEHLNPGARVAIISFHSLEDRIVKRAFRSAAKGCECPHTIPYCVCGKTPTLKILTKKPLTAGDEERETNPRARSAKLRVAERLPFESEEIGNGAAA